MRQHRPNARVVYDLFHVIAEDGREVIGRGRVDAANPLRHDKPARKAVERAHWLLLRNRANLAESERIQLSEVLQANQTLMTVYAMKEQRKALWNAGTARAWRRAWRQWRRHARESAIPALMHFAR
ncbi:ISL3 family transposase, partial [Xanthomonas theicola]